MSPMCLRYIPAMFTTLEVPQQQQASEITTNETLNINDARILKSKENIFKTKRDKVLKKKLKKYRLRKDGKEDDDIIDVSKILISSLKIKSPNNQEVRIHSKTSPKERLPKNYLFKMVRKKNACANTSEKNTKNILENNGGDKKLSPLLPETESKQMNAFKLLMDSRNKSIGGNSPGKERVINANYEIEHCKQKELKAKRTLVLQQMAQKKGYIKNQENEDYIDECIKRKLEKRADRLKEMITLNNSKSEHKFETKNRENRNLPKQKKQNSSNKLEDKKTVTQNRKLQLFNFLSDDDNSQSQESNITISPEDDEFLKKLAPSIRKKENMLSYFKKVTKDVTEPDVEINVNSENESSIIKVKLTSKPKKKKLDNSKANSDDIVLNKSNEISSETNNSTRKRKRDKTISHSPIRIEEEHEKIENLNSNGRPKRNVKKPLKYSSDMLSSSSDEDLHIFTPRKKKIVENRIDLKHKPKNDNSMVSIVESKNKVKEKMVNVSENKSNKKSKKSDTNIENIKAVKLAPIFSTKSKLTPIQQEAKQNFLKSGVPDKLKIKNKDCNNVVLWNNFYTTVHIQPKENTDLKTLNFFPEILQHKTVDWIAISDRATENKDAGYDDTHIFEKLLALTSDENVTKVKVIPLKHKPEHLLNHIKKMYLKFPVYRTFHLLKQKGKTQIMDCTFSELDNSMEIVKDVLDINNDYLDKLNWNDKYKPVSSKQIIGNFDSVKELKRWLESWSENQMKNKNDLNGESDLSDFCFSDSDTDSRDTFKHTNNVLIISGRSGTGKTSCVYAVAAELAIKVIEVNASSKRTGKIMLQDLQEATQSHKVNRCNNKKDGSQSSQDKFTASKIVKKHGRPKKTYGRQSKSVNVVETDTLSQQSQTSSQESTRTEMSLILIDDADIVFDQDDGFCSAVSQLIHYSKRPVILITSSLTCPHLQKYISFGKIIKMNPLLPRMLGTWLDIMSLADTNSCYPGFGCKLLDYFRGDIRKTINYLQFYMTSNKHLNQIDDASQDIDKYKANIDDENSSMSWADQDTEDNVTKDVDDFEIKTIVAKQLRSLDLYEFDIFNVWWNATYQFSPESKRNADRLTTVTKDISLNDMSSMLDTLSYIDYLDHNVNCNTYHITSKPWLSIAVPSVIEKENMDCYSIMNDISKDISQELAMRSLSILNKCEDIPQCPPTVTEQRKKNKVVHQHNTLSKYLNPSSSLDRRALALDYWSSCRTICRHEKNKTDNNLKRNNRFCHYLKSLNILCKNDYFDDLCESLT